MCTNDTPETLLGMLILPIKVSNPLYEVLTTLEQAPDTKHRFDCECEFIHKPEHVNKLCAMYTTEICPRAWPKNLFKYSLPCLYIPDQDISIYHALMFLMDSDNYDLIDFMKQIHAEFKQDDRMTHTLVMFKLTGTQNNLNLHVCLHGIMEYAKAYTKTMVFHVHDRDLRIQSYNCRRALLNEVVDVYCRDYFEHK